MKTWIARRRRERLVVKLNRAWWRSAYLSANAQRNRDSEKSDRQWDLSEDLFAILESLKAGEPVDSPFPADPWPPIPPTVAALRALTSD